MSIHKSITYLFLIYFLTFNQNYFRKNISFSTHRKKNNIFKYHLNTDNFSLTKPSIFVTICQVVQ